MNFYEKSFKKFEHYLLDNNLKHSDQRAVILDYFLKLQEHITIEEFYHKIKKLHPEIGQATVYRTMKLLCDSGICSQVILENGIVKYEPLNDSEHHDHLICLKCGTFIEITCPEIEELQEKIAAENGFLLKRHKLEMYGVCKKCQ